jgi:signal peptidase I
MALITSLVLAAFASYVGAWYFGAIEGNFALLLFVATVVTGLYWLAERFYFLPKREQAAARLESSMTERNARLAGQGITQVDTADTKASERLLMQPWWLDWTAGLFPVILVVFLLRSFLYEPFKIPSGSMMPTLLTGDLILVNKFTYGLRLPVINTKITDGTPLARGDVVVFRYPPKPSMDYIKRVVGIPGDEVAYLNKKLTINGQPVSKVGAPTIWTANRCACSSSSTRTSPASSTRSSTTKARRPSCRAPATSRSARTAATPSKAWSARCPSASIS